MSTIWTPHDPVTVPPRWIALTAGVIVIVFAVGSLLLGFVTGWSRGTPQASGADDSDQGQVLEATPMDPQVVLRGVNAAEPPKVEATNTATNAATEAANAAREAEAPQPP